MKRFVLVLFVLFLGLSKSPAQVIKELQTHWWQPYGGNVNDIYRNNSTLYIAGAFSYVGPNNSYAGVLNFGDKIEPTSFKTQLNGAVKKAVPDQNGGWYVIGSFTSVFGVPRAGIARLNSDGSLHPWNPSVNASVNDIIFYNNTIYIGGTFSMVNSVTRNNICAIDTSGNLTSWIPNANSEVKVFKLFNGKLLVGGSFTNIGGQNRSRIAELDITTGNATTWNKDVNNTVWAIETAGSKIFVGGDFTGAGGSSTNRKRLACFDYDKNTLTNFNVSADATVKSILFTDGYLYVGGDFTTLNTSTQKFLSKLDTSGVGALTSFSPGITSTSGSVNTIVKVKDYIVVGGYINRNSQYGVLTYSTSGSYLADYTPKLSTSNSNQVYTISVYGDEVFIGGNFSSAGGILSQGLAAIDVVSGKPKIGDINKISSGTVNDIEVKDSLMYIAGSFSVSIGSNLAQAVAAYNMNSEKFVYLNIQVANPFVNAIKVDGNNLYLAGTFNTVNGLARQNFALFDLTSGNVAPLTVNCNGTMSQVEITGDTAWLVGYFTTVNGTSRNNLAAFNKNSGVLYAWNPIANNNVYCIQISGNSVYVGGSFTTIGGASRNRLAEIDRSTGLATSWNPNANQSVSYLDLYNNTLYVGGSFTTIKSQAKNYFAAINLSTDSLVNTSSPNGGIYKAWIDNDFTFLGGSFSSIDGSLLNNLAAYVNTCKAYVSRSSSTLLCTNDTLVVSATFNKKFSYSWVEGGNILIPGESKDQLKVTKSGSYRAIIMNNERACVDTSDAIQINYFPRSFATLTPNTDTAFCVNSPFTLSVDSSSLVTGIKWYKGASLFAQNKAVAPYFSTSGDFRAVVTNSYGCIDTSKTLRVTVNPLPTATIFGGASSICGNDSVIIQVRKSSTQGVVYQWKLNGAVLPAYQDTFAFAKDSGQYQLVLVSPLGCSNVLLTRNIKKGEKPIILLSDTGNLNICSGFPVAIYQKDSATNRMTSYNWLRNGISTNLNKPIRIVQDNAKYRLIGVNSAGCRDTSVEVVTVVNPTPIPMNVTGPTLCVTNKTYTYNAENKTGSTFRWWVTNGSQVSGGNTYTAGIKWTAAGVGEMKVVETTSAGCKGDTASLLVTVEQPILLLDKSSIVFGSSDGLTQTVNVTSNLSWVITVTGEASWLGADVASGNGDATVTLGTLIANTTGASKIVTVTFDGGTLSRDIQVTQLSSVGLNDIQQNGNFSVYPNPSNGGSFTIKSNSNTPSAYCIKDITGKVVVERTSLSKSTEQLINIALQNGLYFVEIESGDAVETIKLIVTK